MDRRGAIQRLRMVVAFSFLLLACCAAPVLAQSAGSNEEGKVGISDARVAAAQSEADEAGVMNGDGEGAKDQPVPSQQQSEPPNVSAELEAPVEPQREPALETPQAITEREESQLAYADLMPAEEAGLLKETFAPQLEAISEDPSRLIEAAKLEAFYSPTEALATVDGEPTLIDSSTPLRAPDAEGKLSKVDLDLEATQVGYTPINALVDVQLPRSAAGEIEVGENGFSLGLQGVAASGQEASVTDDGAVFVPDAGEDASLLLSPISTGVEISAMLASRRSPEQLTFSVSVPEGDQLRVAADGGAEVLDPEGEVAYRITVPRAIDAQGTLLPVTMSVKRSTIALSLAHRQMDVAYPILVDPEAIEEGWSTLMAANKWQWEWSGVPSSETSPITMNRSASPGLAQTERTAVTLSENSVSTEAEDMSKFCMSLRSTLTKETVARRHGTRLLVLPSEPWRGNLKAMTNTV